MTRSLEGKRYFACSNNGVMAVVGEATYRNIEVCRQIGFRLSGDIADFLVHVPTTPVFTFAREERQEKDPWITGTRELLYQLKQYIHSEGGEIQDGDFHVPFSNAAELGVHGIAAQRAELRFVTTHQQFEEVFGISPRHLERGPSSR